MPWIRDAVRIECVEGDIAVQPDFEAVVCAANARLAPGTGVSGALHRVAGPGLYAEARPFAPLEVGQAVVTSGHGLPNRWVIHALGPVYAVEEDPAGKLAKAYRNVLGEAEASKVRTIAIPALSTGVFGYPKEEAAPIMVDTLDAMIPGLRSICRIRFVLSTANDLDTVVRAFANRWGPETCDASKN